MLRHGVMIGRHDEVVMVVVVVLVTLVSVVQLARLLAGACREQLLTGLRRRWDLHFNGTFTHRATYSQWKALSALSN